MLKPFFDLTQFAHTAFALPFALLAMLYAAGGRPTAWQIGWILAAMVGARTAAMAYNRIADREIDALNPRTAGRPLQRGAIPLRAAALLVAASVALLLVAAAMLNFACFTLAPLALALLLGYSHTKRFTWLSHIVLGACLGMAPVGAWLAVRGSFAAAPLALGAGVLFWVAGFDVLYACDDVDVDRRLGLHSIPARFGVAAALAVSAALHVPALAGFAAAGVLAGAGLVYFAGCGAVAVLLAAGHLAARPSNLGRLNRAFLPMNGAVGLCLLAAGGADSLLPREGVFP